MPSPSLTPCTILTDPSSDYAPEARWWQGIATIERAATGRLWAAWYSGERFEMPHNYTVLAYSDDDGATWHDPELIVMPAEGDRTFDPCLWIDPNGKLWLFWAQSGDYQYNDGYCGVWAITSEDHADGKAHWSDPFRICHGIMIQKPLVTSAGEWLLPVSNWAVASLQREKWVLPEELRPHAGAGVVATTDEGKTWEQRGSVKMRCASYDEHNLVERRDGSLWLVARTCYGIGQSESRDAGRTWSGDRATDWDGPDAKCFLRRLRSGNLLLVNHVNFTGRSHLTALLSRDDGETWEGGLLLDERDSVSYPDGCEADDGTIRVIYDRERGGMNTLMTPETLEQRRQHAREVLMARFTEQDVLAGKCVNDAAKLKMIVSALGPRPNFTFEQYLRDGGVDWKP